LRLLIDQIQDRLPATITPQDIRQFLVEITNEALESEKEHQLSSIRNLIDSAAEHLDERIEERLELLDTYFDALTMEDEEGRPRRPAEVMEEISTTVRVPLRFTPKALQALIDDPELAAGEARQQIEETLVTRSIVRLVGAIERRLGVPLGLNEKELASKEWPEMADQVLQVVEDFFADRQKRLMGPDGLIIKDIDYALPRLPHPWDTPEGVQDNLTDLLLLIPQGTITAFDKKTHRKVRLRTRRMSFVYYLAHLLENREPEDITDHALRHLEEAQNATQIAWGLSEWSRLKDKTFADLDEQTRWSLLSIPEIELSDQKILASLPEKQQELIIDELGRRTLTALYRQLLLSVIGELWVEYLTQMEALRVSIGLEAYAQRDPLVQYKSKASELFQGLFNDMRTGVVTRMYTYRPRNLSSVQTGVTRVAAAESEDASIAVQVDANPKIPEKVVQAPPQSRDEGKRKRRRKRH
jgi:preprotein translocase subunit SecA